MLRGYRCFIIFPLYFIHCHVLDSELHADTRCHERTERLQRDNRTLVGSARISRWTSYREVSRTRNVRHGLPVRVPPRRGVALTMLVTRAETRRPGEVERGDGGRAYRGPARYDFLAALGMSSCSTRAHPLLLTARHTQVAPRRPRAHAGRIPGARTEPAYVF